MDAFIAKNRMTSSSESPTTTWSNRTSPSRSLGKKPNTGGEPVSRHAKSDSISLALATQDIIAILADDAA